MPYIKKLHLFGFKSFARPTDIVFDKGLNAIVGANGSGKSNIVDAICFVLGRLKIKSLRASRAANLIYHGGKSGKPSQSAKVSIIFDNSDKALSVAEAEVELARIVRRDGSSVYKINGKTKTRQEVLELLASAGIDPEGFNIILQAEINSIVQLRGEEKREIIEEIAGISVYEERKSKSLNELAKTEEKLKEVKTILAERAAYMRNLEKEKSQAEKYRALQEQLRKCRAALVLKKVDEKRKDVESLDKKISSRKASLEAALHKAESAENRIVNLDKQIQAINQHIEQRSGVEQEQLFSAISELRQAAAVLNVRLENFKEQLSAIDKRANQLDIDKIRLEQELKALEQEKSRAVEQELNIEEFKAELIKAAEQLQQESAKLNSTFSGLVETVRARKIAIDDAVRQNKVKLVVDEVAALIYCLEQSISSFESISKRVSRLSSAIAGLKLGKGESRNIGLELELCRKELEKIKEIARQSGSEKTKIEQRISELQAEHAKKVQLIEEKEALDNKLRKAFEKLLMRKSRLQGELKKQELLLKEREAEVREIEAELHTLAIMKAKLEAELEIANSEARGYELTEITEISGSKAELEARALRYEQELSALGSVNLRALEVYDRLKIEYDEIVAKVQQLEQEKAEILKIIDEIDKKKKQTFMVTFNAINEAFGKNFVVLDAKGRNAYLELESKEDPFAGGVDIVIKLGKGKYIDADSLSGGEKVITALALLFAIQKYKPYSFYIFDEIDPALDKNNSERFAALLKEAIKNSQCLIITHNDAVINQADTLYGASMQEGISKIISLKV